MSDEARRLARRLVAGALRPLDEDLRPGDAASMPPEDRPISVALPLDDLGALIDLVRALVDLAAQATILSRAGLLVAEGDDGPYRGSMPSQLGDELRAVVLLVAEYAASLPAAECN